MLGPNAVVYGFSDCGLECRALLAYVAQNEGSCYLRTKPALLIWAPAIFPVFSSKLRRRAVSTCAEISARVYSSGSRVGHFVLNVKMRKKEVEGLNGAHKQLPIFYTVQ